MAQSSCARIISTRTAEVERNFLVGGWSARCFPFLVPFREIRSLSMLRCALPSDRIQRLEISAVEMSPAPAQELARTLPGAVDFTLRRRAGQGAPNAECFAHARTPLQR